MGYDTVGLTVSREVEYTNQKFVSMDYCGI
jgi:hypothetical protein